MKQKIKLVISLFAAAPAFCSAANWQLAVITDNGGKFYIDSESITKVGPYYKAWSKEEYLTPDETNSFPKKQFMGGKLLWYFDCKRNLSAPVQRVLYAGPGASGDIVESRSKNFSPDLLRDAAPETAHEGLQMAACASPKYRALLHKQLSEQ
ncbi:surface-adhesin E family protein [Massilia aquatica]|uniref:Surface-adhesin protein E-like domain-containing protein n=1 Tax=Massilia aquatica TaxID=2609000 RepID=A0ABX0MPR6_9BURK|nr:surface-adhesin E family protein [Massilia aquatica]NHZ44211.1 hypothetical protein [Massilia aquatica]